MKTVILKTATHIHAEPGTHSVSDAECARLCALGVAEQVTEAKAETEPAEEPKQKRTRRRAGK
jgi:hypothetical protein